MKTAPPSTTTLNATTLNAATPNAAPWNAAGLKAAIVEYLKDDLAAVNDLLCQKLRSASPFVNDVTQHVGRFRGKQIRPILLLLTSRMLNGSACRNATVLATVVEMIHMATLVHDDVVDGAETRRHVATVHHRWNTETSVLLGDFLFSRSFHLAATTGDAEACRLIGLATDRTCEGELNQVAARSDDRFTEIDYFRIIRGKTGQLFALSCLLGARCAGATNQQERAAYRFGMRIGMAFQITDDNLDLSAPGTLTGKDEGNDLVNGRQTLPLLRAFELASPEQRQDLIATLESDDLDAVRGKPLIQRGIESAATTAQHLSERAIAQLRQCPEGTPRILLEGIASISTRRQA